MSERQTKVVIIIGAPGAGKGTQCKILTKKTGMLHISTGDMCREAMRMKTHLGARIAHYYSQNILIPDELMIDVIEQRLQQPDAVANGVLLDGYPRTIKQAIALAKSNIDIDRVILIQVSDHVCIERITNRRMDPITGDSYSIKFPELYCHDPNVKLVQRSNDVNNKVIKSRLNFYHVTLGQILKLFPGKIFPVNGSRNVTEVADDMRKFMVPMKKVIITQKINQIQQQLCAICMSEPADYLIVPCGHQCGCKTCLLTLTRRDNAKCPICRNRMTEFVQVFKSGIDDNENQMVDDEIISEQVEMDVDVQDDGGWGAEEQMANQMVDVTNFEKNISKGLQISVSPVDNINSEYGANNINIAISIKVPDISLDNDNGLTNRAPVDICCIIDISGSMACDAKFQDPNDETKTINEGITILDIVKHSVKTVIHTLCDQDRLSIVAFNDTATTVCNLLEMNSVGKTKCIEALNSLIPNGRTNIWDGLKTGLNSLDVAINVATGSTIPRKKSIFLLTDGQPVTRPPHGEVYAFNEYKEAHPNVQCQVHTFGFGYELHSDLLLDLAIIGNGSYGFIPDAKIVGTCFVDAVANACTTFCQRCNVHIIPKNGATFGDGQNDFIGGLIPCTKTGNNIVANLGHLQYGQSRDILVHMSIPPGNSSYIDVVVDHESSEPGCDVHRVVTTGINRNSTSDSIVAYTRNKTVEIVSEVISKCTFKKGIEGSMMMKSLVGKVTAIESINHDERISGLLKDLSGRMTKAISTVERFKRWGGHYLRAITRAHQLQICTNFMDTGLQVYGGTLFSKLRDDGGKIFLTLPLQKSQQAPRTLVTTNSNKRHQTNLPTYNQPTYNRSTYNRPLNTPPSTTSYYNSGGGCFDATCFVRDSFGDKVSIVNVHKGDILKVVDANGNEKTARVRYVIRIKINNDNLVKFKDTGLKLSGKHPVRINKEWIRPQYVIDNKSIVWDCSSEKYLYNIILNREKVTLLVNDTECVTWGHGFKEVWHPFYASSESVRKVEALSKEQNNKRFVDFVN